MRIPVTALSSLVRGYSLVSQTRRSLNFAGRLSAVFAKQRGRRHCHVAGRGDTLGIYLSYSPAPQRRRPDHARGSRLARRAR
jgi:hypothetical protein